MRAGGKRRERLFVFCFALCVPGEWFGIFLSVPRDAHTPLGEAKNKSRNDLGGKYDELV